jgi:hypothetical protein
MSKGSKPRPLSVPKDEFDASWDRIFGGDKDEVDLSKETTSDDSEG